MSGALEQEDNEVIFSHCESTGHLNLEYILLKC